MPSLRIIPHTYRSRPGFLITGRDTKGRRCRIFAASRPVAEHIRTKVKAGQEITSADFQPPANTPVGDLWTPEFGERWRHGGWYVTNLQYPSGGIGCVAKRDDGRWMVACDSRENPPTYPNREAAARAERVLVLAEGGTDK